MKKGRAIGRAASILLLGRRPRGWCGGSRERIVVAVDVPYSFAGQMILDEITGGTPYGATTIAGGDGSRMPSENELDGARFQGRHVADIADRLFVEESAGERDETGKLMLQK
jgi:hypothetical protein